MWVVEFLFFILNRHFHTQTGSWEHNFLVVGSEFDLVSNLISNVFVPQSKYMMNRKIFIRHLVISPWVVSLFEIAWVKDLPLERFCCHSLFSLNFLNAKLFKLFFLFQPLFVKSLILDFGFRSQLRNEPLVFEFLSIIVPDDDGFLFTSDADEMLSFSVKLKACNFIGMSYIFVVDFVLFAGVVKQFNFRELVSNHKDIFVLPLSLATDNIILRDTLSKNSLGLWTKWQGMCCPFRLINLQSLWFLDLFEILEIVNVVNKVLFFVCIKSDVLRVFVKIYSNDLRIHFNLI